MIQHFQKWVLFSKIVNKLVGLRIAAIGLLWLSRRRRGFLLLYASNDRGTLIFDHDFGRFDIPCMFILWNVWAQSSDYVNYCKTLVDKCGCLISLHQKKWALSNLSCLLIYPETWGNFGCSASALLATFLSRYLEEQNKNSTSSKRSASNSTEICLKFTVCRNWFAIGVDGRFQLVVALWNRKIKLVAIQDRLQDCRYVRGLQKNKLRFLRYVHESR